MTTKRSTRGARLSDAPVGTHGSSARRMQWSESGSDSGDPRSCDTFARR
jgi:predicted metalloprotease